MVYLSATLKAFFSVISLFLLTKIIGRRQVSQLSLFDYVNGISFGSIAAEMALCKNYEDFFVGLIAMAVYAAVALSLDKLSNRSIVLRRFLEGVPIVLVEDGKIYEKNFTRCKIDLNEFLMRCRSEGYFEFSEIDVAIFEPNGTISIRPKSADAPIKVRDLNLPVPQTGMAAVAVIDGVIMENNLKSVGYERKYVEKTLSDMNVKQKDVFFASLSPDGKLDVYQRTNVFPKEKLE